MSEPRRSTRIASYCLISQPGHILLCRISAQLPGSQGKWTLPGGGLDFGEHPEAGAVREALEETGFEVLIDGLANINTEVFRYDEEEIAAFRLLYWAQVVGGSLRDEMEGSTDKCDWIPLDRIHEFELVEIAQLGAELVSSKQGLCR